MPAEDCGRLRAEVVVDACWRGLSAHSKPPHGRRIKNQSVAPTSRTLLRTGMSTRRMESPAGFNPQRVKISWRTGRVGSGSSRTSLLSLAGNHD